MADSTILVHELVYSKRRTLLAQEIEMLSRIINKKSLFRLTNYLMDHVEIYKL